jgi:hypothetical protein
VLYNLYGWVTTGTGEEQNFPIPVFQKPKLEGKVVWDSSYDEPGPVHVHKLTATSRRPFADRRYLRVCAPIGNAH